MINKIANTSMRFTPNTRGKIVIAMMVILIIVLAMRGGCSGEPELRVSSELQEKYALQIAEDYPSAEYITVISEENNGSNHMIQYEVADKIGNKQRVFVVVD